MKTSKFLNVVLGFITAVTVIVGSFAVNPMEAHAEKKIVATVTGTVSKGTDSSTLYLATAQGDMIIKLDSDTEASCKLLLPGSTVYVAVYYGSDAYMHAASISASNNTQVDTSQYKTSTVSGTIADKAMDGNIMYVQLGDDVMHVKLDASTDYSGCGVLYAGKSITLTVYRGDDAYMHALRITDGAGSGSAAAAQTYVDPNANTTPVTGTVNKNSNSTMLFLDSKDGTYQLKLDANTNYSNGYMLIFGKKITAYIYRGNDAYMHVSSIARTGSLSNTSSGSTNLSFTGTVTADSTDGTMFLQTSGGKMTIRIDANTQFNSSSPIYTGSKVSVAAVNCSDEYWHATSISVIN